MPPGEDWAAISPVLHIPGISLGKGKKKAKVCSCVRGGVKHCLFQNQKKVANWLETQQKSVWGNREEM